MSHFIEKFSFSNLDGNSLDSSFESEKSTSQDNEDDIPVYITPNDYSNSFELIPVINSALCQLITVSPKSNKGQSIFDSIIPPQIQINDYLTRIVHYTNLECSTLINSLIYLDRICETSVFSITKHNIHKLLFSSILISIKFNEDRAYKNQFYAQVAGVPLKELNKMEYEILLLLNFKVYIDESLFTKYKRGLLLFCQTENVDTPLQKIRFEY